MEQFKHRPPSVPNSTCVYIIWENEIRTHSTTHPHIYEMLDRVFNSTQLVAMIFSKIKLYKHSGTVQHAREKDKNKKTLLNLICNSIGITVLQTTQNTFGAALHGMRSKTHSLDVMNLQVSMLLTTYSYFHRIPAKQ